MKRIIIPIIILAAVVISGCNREERERGEGEKAELTLNISSEGEFTPVPSDATKAGDSWSDAPDVNDFSVSILDASTGKAVQSWSKFSDVPAVVAMDPGEYRIEAASPGTKRAAWSQPKFFGSQSVTIAPGKVENINLQCTLANMKVTVLCTEKFLAEMNPDFTVTVSSNYGPLIFTPEIIANGQSGYFDAGTPLIVDVNATRKTCGKINEHVEIQNGSAKDHHIFTLDASETGYANASAESAITIDYTCNNREEEIYVDSLAENPIDEVPVPELTSSSIAEGATDVAAATSTIDLTYSTAVALAEGASITLNDQACSVSVTGSIVTVTLPTLAEGTAYTLSVPAGAVVSSLDAQAAAEAFTLNFTTASSGTDEPETDAITITATAGIDEPVTYSKAALPSEFNLTVEAPAGIANFIVDVRAEGLRQLLDGVLKEVSEDERYTVDLANMDTLKLGFWGALFGITDNSDVNEQTSKTFAIGTFLAAMPDGTNDLGITIRDKNGNELSKTLTIIITTE